MRQALTFYKFTHLDDPEAVQSMLQDFGLEQAVRGTILVASEGVNGTLIGSPEALTQMRSKLSELFGEMPFKWSQVDEQNQGFFRFKVKLKKEIVTFGVSDLDVSDNGEHVDVETWNSLLEDPDVVVIDTRNQYEIDIGTFPGSVSPNTTNFREFPRWVEESLDPEKQPKIAMFCTGGIRCEKASAYMKSQGFSDVYQLDGGILKYLEDATEDENRWDGECFVFDQRVSVNSDLEQGSYRQCYACRHPVSEEDMASVHYEKGVSCPHCVDADYSEQRRRQFRERQRQVELAVSRGEQHIGGVQESLKSGSK